MAGLIAHAKLTASYVVASLCGAFALVLLVAAFNLPQPGPLGLVPVWAVVCGIAAWKRQMIEWAFLCLSPLALVSIDWLSGLGKEDPFGMRLWDIQLFAAAALVTAATGILSLIHHPVASHQFGNQD